MIAPPSLSRGRPPTRLGALSITLALVVFTLIPTTGRAGMVVQACFSPGGKCADRIIRELKGAQKEILVAVYAFTNEELAWTVVRAHERGVKVQVVLDKDFDGRNESSQGAFLESRGLAVRRATGVKIRQLDSGLMHQKFAVIDGKVVVTGSYNWTQGAERFNDENLLVFRDAGALAEEYRKEFFRLWEKKE